MNHKRFLYFGIMLAILLLVSACAAAGPTTGEFSEALSCPTSAPLFCPTAAAQTMPKVSAFRWSIAGIANAIVTFEAGDKCSLQVVNPVVKKDGLMIDVVANDDTYQDYIVSIYYLEPGKTVEDVNQWTDAINPPSWLHAFSAVSTTPMSRPAHLIPLEIDASKGPIYFTCQVNGPGARKIIGNVGPLDWK